MSANIEALVKKHIDRDGWSLAPDGEVASAIRNALTEQAEAFKGELQAYDGMVRELTKTVEDMQAAQSVPVEDVVLPIASAYESGVGHCNDSLCNPYKARSAEAYAYDYGKEFGKSRGISQSVPVVGEPVAWANEYCIDEWERSQKDNWSGARLTAKEVPGSTVPLFRKPTKSIPAAELATLREKAAMADELRGKLEISECGMAAALAEGDRIMSDWQEQIRKTCAALKQRNDAEKERDELRKDAARGRLLIERGEWIRRNHDTDEAHSLLAIRLPYDADLSCKAMCEDAIDAAIAQGKGE